MLRFLWLLMFAVEIWASSSAPNKKIAFQLDKSSVVFEVEVADTEELRSLGLMFRQSIPEKGGMLFIFPTSKDHGFWMKNTLISLDIIYLDENLVIVGMVKKALPGDLSILKVGAPSKYVLELNAGMADQYGLTKGRKGLLVK